MIKRRWLLLTLVAIMVLSLGLTGCDGNEPAPSDEPNNVEDPGDDNSQEPSDGGEKLASEQVIRMNWGSEPPDLDQQTTTDQVSFEVLNSVLEGLVRLNPDGSIGEGLAESYEVSEDGKVYTFKLRDAKWSDGEPVTAYDFEYGWFRAIDANVAAEYAYQFTDTASILNATEYFNGEITDKNEVGIKAIDEKTFQVTLTKEVPFFDSLTSFITFFPTRQDIVEKYGDNYALEPENMVYCGPFVIEEWLHEQSLTLAKNPNYWDAENVKLEKIIGDMITDNNTAVNLYDVGELDIIGVPSEFMERYENTEEFLRLAEATTWYIQYNCEDEMTSNKNLRYALSLAIDSQAFVDNVLANGSIVAGGLTPALLPGKDGKEFAENRGYIVPKHDATKAKEYFDKALEELGVTAEEVEKHLTFLTGESDTARRYAAAIQEMWKQNLGITPQIEAVSFAIRLDRYNNRDYTASFAGWGGDYNDPLTFMDLFVTNGGNNDAYFSNADYDAAIKEALEAEGDARIDAMLKAEQVLAEELPVFPIYYNARNIVQKSFVKDVARFPVGADIDFKWAYVIEH